MGEDLAGQTLGPFAIERRVGQGAMGAVYVARHRETGKQVAIKVMAPRDPNSAPKLAARFEREIKLLGKFRHPNIVRFYGASEDRGIRYYAMEYVEGAPLDHVLDKAGVLPLSKTIGYVVQICEALQEMHSTGVVHRDLKPANILVTRDNKIKLTDFGIAKDTSALHERQLTAADHTVGTVAFMSPEQLAGRELTRKSDLYALGIVMYRMLTGRLPFTGETMFEYVQQRQSGIYPAPTTLNSDLPLEIDKLLSELLSQKPEDRPRDAYVVMQRLLDLAKAIQDGTVSKSLAKPTVTTTETVEMKRGVSTLLSTVFGARRASVKKQRRKGDSDVAASGSLLESPWVLAGALLAVLVFTAYMLFWPLSDDQMFARGKAIMEAPSASLVDMEKADSEYFAKILEHAPDSPHAPAIARYRATIAVEQARTRVKAARRRGFRPADDASEAERQFVQALELKEKEGDVLTADGRFRALIEVFGDDADAAPWVALANEELLDQTDETAQERRATKRRLVQEKLSKLEEKREREGIGPALEEYVHLERLYGSDAEVSDLIRAQGVLYLPPEDILAAGHRLMQSDQPTDWQDAFRFYLDPLVAKYPSYANDPKMVDARDKRDKHNRYQDVLNHLAVGLPKDAGAAETVFTTAMYIWKKLGDDLTARDCLRSFLETSGNEDQNRVWGLLAKDAVAQIEDIRDFQESVDQRRLEKRELARRSLARLEDIIRAEPELRTWREPVHTVYREDADTQEVVEEFLN